MSTNQINGPEVMSAARSGQDAMGTASAAGTQRSGQLQRAEPMSAEASSTDVTPFPLEGNGFTLRVNWGRRHGQWVLPLNSGRINARPRVFVAISEGNNAGVDAGKFIGSARYTVHNVAPRAGGVDILIEIEWNADILLYVDYFVVNP